ncbi:FKBP-type peptidyl-prolyl cis-trans isomerase [Acinetobacter sp. HY1485]|uniref:FKBP-type peptidyl-prolyl cis-trans isomerase n=1 Tax=Acinetobacter sp. HY1485 TaxID=2970918 RepID=UPI0022B9779D|nr:FKBP-type peptidyl-prolyl cis-trans isomerase [Acinetobacter sp. HY1485]
MKKMFVFACTISCFSTAVFSANGQSNEQNAYQKGYQAAQSNKNADAFIQGVLASTQDNRLAEQQQSSRNNTTQVQNTRNDNQAINNRSEQTQNTRNDNRQYANNTMSTTNLKEKAFFNENERQLGMITTPSGLQYKVLKAGLGRMPQSSNNVKVSYEIRLLDDSVVEKHEDRVIRVSRFFEGLTEGLQTMRERGKTRFFVPSRLAYGEAGTGNVPSNSTLIVDVELLKVE